jgi:hypothetical protein
LKDLSETVDEALFQYKAIAEEYSEWVGSFLRDLESEHKDEEWFKKLSGMQKAPKKVENEGKGKSKKKGQKGQQASECWIAFKDVTLSSSEQGEAEMLLEALEEINGKIAKLTKIKEAIEDLKKAGIGKDVLYIVYIKDDIPEKIVVQQKQGNQLADKFKFIADFCVSGSS